MFLTAITFLIILTILVLIHELGHFLVARWVGVRVEEFGLGLPPMVWGKKIGETVYSLNWLPIGGFVRLAGEDQDPAARPAKLDATSARQYFWARSKKERSAILAAGVFMNFFLAVAITAGLLVTGVKEPSGRVHVERVISGGPAEQAGILVGDVVRELKARAPGSDVDVVIPKTPNELITYVNGHKGKQITVALSRNNQPVSVVVTPRTDVPPGQGPLGIAISDLEVHTYPISVAPAKAVSINLNRAWEMLASLGTTVARLARLEPPQADVAGPIGIAQVTGQAVKFGWQAVLEFASILSLNLAVLNVLPIPALDGGRLAFVFLEKALGKKVRPAFEKTTHQIGMIILLGLIVLVSINDILRLVRGG